MSRTSFLEAYDHDSDLRSANQRARAQDVKQDSPNPRGNGRSGTVIYTMHATGLRVLLPTAGDNPDLSKLRSAAAEVNEAIAAMTKNRSEELFNAQAGIDYLANVTGGFPYLTPLYSEVPGHGSVVRNLLDVETRDLTFSNAAGWIIPNQAQVIGCGLRRGREAAKILRGGLHIYHPARQDEGRRA